MPPLNSLETWSVRSSRGNRKPKSKCFFIGEGPNTEYWYLKSLAVRLAKMNAPELIELRPVERTGNERNQSAPKKLLEQAQLIRDDAETYGFDPNADRIVVFFDADVYKGDSGLYMSDLDMFSGVAEVAVTNPSFELYLLLHLDDALEKYVLPNEEEILGNGYVGRRRYVEKLASDVLGFNVKRNEKVGELARRFGIAAMNERTLNQDPSQSIGRLTSNVGARIMEVMHTGASSEESYLELCRRLGIEDESAE